MGSLGAELRRLREARGADLEHVAAATKVGVHHLAALERGDFGALPGEVFVRGFVRAYADFLGTGGERLLALYRQDRDEQAASESGMAERTIQEMSRILASAPPRPASRPGLALRFAIDGRAGMLLVALGGVAMVVVGLTALTLRGKHLRESAADIPPPGALPARASRAAAPVLPPSPAVSSPPASAPSSAASTPSPAPSPAPDPVEAPREPNRARSDKDALEIPEHGVGSRVADGKLDGATASFQEGDAVFFFTRINGGKKGEVVRHVWMHDDREVHSIDLSLGGAQWRTWSRKAMRPGSAGHWSVEARDAYGRVLASEEFDCRPKP